MGTRRIPHDRIPPTDNPTRWLPERAVTKGIAKGQDGDRVGVYGSSVKNTGVFGKSEKAEGVRAETDSTTTSAMAAYQMNPASDHPAFFAKHAGNRKAARFEGDVEVLGELSIQGVGLFGLVQHIRQLQRQVDLLSAQLSEHTRNHSGSGTARQDFQISVTISAGEVKVTGKGFRPDVTSFVFIWYPDYSRKKFDSTPDGHGNLNFTIPTTQLCISGVPLSLRFEVNQPDGAGRDKWTNSVTETVTC